MQKVFLCGFTLLALGVFTHPNPVAAETVPTPSAVRLSDTHVLFSTNFKVGYLNRSATLPLATVQGLSPKALGYIYVDEAGRPTPIVSQAVILPNDTDVDVVNNGYVLPYGKSETFTLYAVAAIPKSADPLALKIVFIPHTMTDSASTTLSVTKLPSTLPALTTPFSN